MNSTKKFHALSILIAMIFLSGVIMPAYALDENLPVGTPTSTLPSDPPINTGNPLLPEERMPFNETIDIKSMVNEQQGKSGERKLYVSATGSDTNSCFSSAAPCSTINYALSKAVNGDVIMAAAGIYTSTGGPVVTLSKAVTLSGGWTSDFKAQTSASIIDGGGVNLGMRMDVRRDNGMVVIDRFVIQNSRSAYGGGIYVYTTELTLKNTTIKNSTSNNGGGGIYTEGTVLLAIENSTITGNFGGGIYLSSSSNLRLNNSTIAYNQGLGIQYTQMQALSYNYIYNSIIAQNGGNCVPFQASTHSIYGSTCPITGTSDGDLFNTDPQLNPTPTGALQYLSLNSNSPAIDAGDVATCLTTDQRGVSRTANICDIGAYEYTPVDYRIVLMRSGTNQHAVTGTSFADPLQALVVDETETPISGVTVTFTAPASGASAVFEDTQTNTTSATTDGNGLATTSTFSANSTAGEYGIYAHVSGVPSSPAGFILVNHQHAENHVGDPSFESFAPGGFYNSPWGAWSATFYVPFCSIDYCGIGNGTAGPHSGTDWIWFGGSLNDESAYISQNVNLPTGHTNLYLRFFLWIGYAESGSNNADAFYITLDNNVIFSANATQYKYYSSYTPVVLDINALADGGTHSLTFTTVTTGQLVNFNLDDVSITEATFSDVQVEYWSYKYVEQLSNAGITGGCGVGIYCPDNTVTRAQMAVFLLKGMHGASYTPPALGSGTGFSDVPADHWAAAWIKQLAAENITSGCGNGNYCPEATVTRDQMAIFLLKAKHGPSYSPTNATGIFTDVPLGYWADKWIEQLATEGITGGCGAGIYCPTNSVTRAQMAVFLVKAFNLP